MTGRVVLRPEPSGRMEPLLPAQPESCSCPTFGEVAGGTAAECAAVCCCCPCGLVNLLLIFMYKLPRGICRRALRSRRRRRMMKEGLLLSPPRRSGCQCGCEEPGYQIHPVDWADMEFPEMGEEVDEEVVKLEKEMWANFDGSGFWRSPSRREPSSPIMLKQP